VGGNDELLARFGALPVYAHASDFGRVHKQTERVEEGNSFTIAAISFRPLHVPGHTLGAVSYCSGEGADQAVFTGDTLFVAGCGRLFMPAAGRSPPRCWCHGRASDQARALFRCVRSRESCAGSNCSI
jgi:glyoxylase-like metal-dependent hydrolase (beta-lactamase superfamily II)